MNVERLTELMAAKRERNIPVLIEALRDPDHRFIAAGHLGELKANEAEQSLILLLRAGDTASRSSAAEALGKLRSAAAVPSLIELARDDEHLVVRTFGITALGAIGDDHALDALCELLNDDEILVRHSAAAALGVLKDVRAIDALENASRRERWYSRRPHRKAIREIHRAGER